MKSLRAALLAPLVATVLSIAAYAADPSGTWKWTATSPSGQDLSLSLKLEYKDNTLSGTLATPRGDTPITAATFKDDQIDFSVVRERNGEKRVTRYHGKLDGDAIKGTLEMPPRDGGEARTHDWTAQRAH